MVGLLNEGTDAEVDEHCLIIVIYHDVVWLDVPVDDTNDLVAVVKSFGHVDDVVADLGALQTHGLHVFASLLLDTELVVLLPFLVELYHLVTEATFGMVLSNEVDVVAFGVVDDLL